MEDADHPDRVVDDIVENPVASVSKGADRGRYCRVDGARRGVSAQQVETALEAAQIILRHLPAKLLDAMVQYLRQIGRGCGAKPEVSHGAAR